MLIIFQRIIIIIAVNVIFFAKILKHKYVSDDASVFLNPPTSKNKWHKVYLWLVGSYKWKAKYDHILTLFTHALICVGIYLAFGINTVSFLAALLFTFCPANNQVSVWPGGRGYALPALLLLYSMAFPIVAPLCLFAAMSFTAGYLIPIALIGSPQWYLLALVPLLWWVHRKKFLTAVSNKSSQETFAEDRKINLNKVVLAIKTMGFYFTLCIIPFRLTFYHSFLQSCAGNEIMKKRAYSLCKFFWIGLAAIVGFLVYNFYRPWDSISYGMLWFFICIAPLSNFRRVQQEVSERYLFIANVGLMVALASIIIHYPLVIVGFLVGYAVRLWFYMDAFRDDYYITEVAVIEDPQAWYAWQVRGFKRWATASYREAMIMWVMAKIISPKEFKVLFNIAVVLRVLKNQKESDEFLKLAEANIVPGQEKAAMQIISEFKQGKHPLVL